MPTDLKLYVWEGDGISGAYHDDGTLVVLAESPERARELVRAEKAGAGAAFGAWSERADATNLRPVTAATREAWAEFIRYDPFPLGGGWDGKDKALDREPDRIVDLTTPTIVAFNGGGYD